MAVMDLVLPSQSALSERNLRLVLVTSAVWLAMLILFSAAAWFDQAVRADTGAPYLAYLAGWTRAMLPWLVLLPIVFRYGKRHENKSLVESAVSVSLAGVISMLILCTWAAFAFSIGTDRGPLEVLTSFRLMDWMWDIMFFVVTFLAGRQMRPRSPPPAAAMKPAPADIAVRSHDKVEYIPVREILGATAQGNYIALHLQNRDVLHRATMASFSAVLAEAGFVRTHRSHMVNPDRVVSAQARGSRVREVRLCNDITLPVSERYNAEVMEHLNGRVFA